MSDHVIAKRDYYEVLGINKDADESTLKKAYRTLAMKYHPDRNPEDSEAAQKMTEINEAYAVLCDREKRGLYDTYGHAGLQGLTQEDIFGGVDFGTIFGDLFGAGSGGSIFDSLFGRRSSGRGRQARRGADLRYDLSVTLEDVAFGKDETIQIPRVETCQSCRGAGAPEGGWKECPTCRGSGQSVTEQRSGYTVFRQVTTCSKCRGKGMLVTKPCEECEGRGQVEKSKEFTVQVPKGADTGYKMKIDGEGESGPAGGQNGDLYIVLNVAQHPLFERHGDDIYVAKEIDLAQATLGGQLEGIPGLEGDLKAHIEEGTQNGAVVRIVNKGIPHPNSHGRGDEYVVLKVVTPTGLNKEEKELLRKFQGLRSRRSE